MSERITIRDVARAAGVSATTVSHTLNGKGRIDQSTRERVLEAVRSTGYMPNPVARSLRSGKTGTIGLSLPSWSTGELSELLHSSWYPSLALGATQAAFDTGHALLMVPSHDSARDLRTFAVDGLVISDPFPNDPRLASLDGSPMPYVTIDTDPARSDLTFVRPDVEAGIRLLLEHLADVGSRSIAVLAPDLPFNGVLAEIATYESWCAQRRIEPTIMRVPMSEAHSFEDVHAMVRDAAKKLLEPGPDGNPTTLDAVVGLCEGWAPLIIEAAHAHGLRVPEDLVVASDIDQPGNVAAGITALEQYPGRQGAKAVQLLNQILSGEEVRRENLIEVTLQVRGSTQRVAR